MIPISLDAETTLISPQSVIPDLVSIQVCVEEGQPVLFSVADEGIEEFLVDLLFDDDYFFVGQNTASDFSVLVKAYPMLIERVFDIYEAGRVTDTSLRERLIRLSTTGKIQEKHEVAVGRPSPFSLAGLVERYLGIDISEDKKGEDTWRLRYGELAHLPSAEWPKEAYAYAVNDAHLTLAVYNRQAERVLEEEASVVPEEKFAAWDFSLKQMTRTGLKIDPDRVRELEEEINEARSGEHMQILRDSFIWHDAIENDPDVVKSNKKVSKDLLESALDTLDKQYDLGLKRTKKGICSISEAEIKKAVFYMPELEVFLPSMAGRTNGKIVKEIVCAAWDKVGKEPKLTPTGAISADAEVIDDLNHVDERLSALSTKQETDKIFTTYIPQLQYPRIHPDYNVLLETGRTSCRGTSKKKRESGDFMYPSVNIQVLPRGFGVRECFVPDDGYYFLFADYSAIEIVSLAWKTREIFGWSDMADIVNSGIDTHAYYAAQLSYALDKEKWGDVDMQFYEPMKAFEIFKTFDQEYYGFWRGRAKAPNLGYGGGLAKSGMVRYAKNTFGIDLVKEKGSVEAAEEYTDTMRRVWLDTYTVMNSYFDYVNKECRDYTNFDDKGDPKYQYTSPLGMVRRGTTYCSTCNGMGMQNPTAHGAQMAHSAVTRLCLDDSRESVLYGCKPVVFLHDEIGIQVPEDKDPHEVSEALCDAMKDSMGLVLTDMLIKVEPTAMRRWSKKAKPSYDDNGRLVIWEPKEKT